MHSWSSKQDAALHIPLVYGNSALPHSNTSSRLRAMCMHITNILLLRTHHCFQPPLIIPSVSSFSFSYYSHSLLSTCAYISTGNSLRITFFDYRKCTSIQIIAFSTLKLWQSFWKKTYKHLAGTRVEPAPNSEYALITCKYGILVTCSPKSMQAIYWCLQVAWHMMITIIA